MGGACGTYGVKYGWVEHFGGETWGKEPAAKFGRRWDDIIKRALKKNRMHVWFL